MSLSTDTHAMAAPLPVPSPWMTSAEAAAYYKVKPRTLLLWARQGKIRGYQLSGVERHVWRFLKSDLDAALLPVTDTSDDCVLESTSSSVIVQ
jgi:excisionase family DNA binding protein